MSENTSDLSQLECKDSAETSHLFYVVSPKKFLILYFSTFGIYRGYWMYKNWSLYKDKTGESVWPIPRAIFSIFFVESLFKKVNSNADKNGIKLIFSDKVWAVAYVITSVIDHISSRLDYKGIAAPYPEYVTFLTFVLLGWIIYKAQVAINLSCGDEKGLSNSSFSLANYFWIVMGFIFYSFLIASSLGFLES